MSNQAAILAIIAALATSGGFWQFMENRATALELALFKERSDGCGVAYVTLANKIAERSLE